MRDSVSFPAAERTTTWEFLPRLDPSSHRDGLERFRGSIDTVLRAGHGLGVSFTLRIGRDADRGLVLTTNDLTSERWVERVLASAYDPGQWRRFATPDPFPEGIVYTGRRNALPGEWLGNPSEIGAVVRAAALAFSTLPRGVSMECTFAPSVVRRPLLAFLRGHRSPLPEVRARPAARFSESARPPPRASTPEPPPPLWRAEVMLRGAPETSLSAVRRAVTAVEGAWRRLDGTGIRFVRAGSLGRRRVRIVLTEQELAGLIPSKDAPPPRGGGATSAPGRLAIGRTHDGTVVGVPVEPTQGRHLAILGETGMGKSSLVVALATRASRLGGVIVLDPLGDSARRVRSELSGIVDRVLWVAPGERPPAINALEGIGSDGGSDPVGSERRIDDIVHALRRVRSGRYADSSFWGPRLEEMLGRAVRAAAAIPGGTLADAHTLLQTMGRTRQVVTPEARDALRELAERVRERPEDAEGARRLLYEVARNPTLERMLCARSPSLSAREFVAPGRVVLVSGDASRVGESTARYLFSVYLALLWSELLARDVSTKTFVILDEAQWFAHESLSEMLRLARRLNVHVVLATQSLGSLPEGVRDSVWTNVADFVAFRGSPEEARDLARAAHGVSAEAILALPRGEAAVFLGKGEAVRWVRTVRLPGSGAHEDDRSDARDPSVLEPPSPTRPEDGPPTEIPCERPPREPPIPPRCADDVILERLRAMARGVAPGATFEVVLDDLRPANDPEGERIVRRAGTVLGRAGAIVRVERGPRGTAWSVDPARIPSASHLPTDRSAEGSSPPPQHS